MGDELLGNDSNMYNNEIEQTDTRFKQLTAKQEELIVSNFRVMGQAEVDELL
jgi:hypothetical protein